MAGVENVFQFRLKKIKRYVQKLCAPQLFYQDFNYFLEKNPALVAEPQPLVKIGSGEPEGQGIFSTSLVAKIQIKPHLQT